MTDREAPVVDDLAHDRFVVDQDGAIAQLRYQAGDDRLVLTHTEVPEEVGGRGVAGRLVRAAAERAVRDGLTLVPWCPCARKWLHDRQDHGDGRQGAGVQSMVTVAATSGWSCRCGGATI